MIGAIIKAFFILFGFSDLSKQQDPVSFNKIEKTMFSHMNKVLGIVINNRKLDIIIPPSYNTGLIRAMRLLHTKQKSFFVREFKIITGMLIHVSNTTPWLKFMQSHVYAFMDVVVGDNVSHLKCTNNQSANFSKTNKKAEI